MEKYELTDEVKTVEGKKHYRIRAVKDIIVSGLIKVSKGTLGGWIAHEDNLSQLDGCWVADEAIVGGDAYVSSDAWVGNRAHIKGYARVTGTATVYQEAVVKDHAWIGDTAMVRGNAIVEDNALVHGSSSVRGNSRINNGAKVRGNAVIQNSFISDEAIIEGCMSINNGTHVKGCTRLSDVISIYAPEEGLVIESNKDIIVFKNNWSSRREFCYLFPLKLWIVGCFTGTSDELVEKAYRDSKLSGDMYKLYVDLVEKMEDSK